MNDEKGKGGAATGGRTSARPTQVDCGGASTYLGNAASRQRGNCSQIEEKLREDDGRYRCSVCFVRIDRFGSQAGDQELDDKTDRTRSLSLRIQPGVQRHHQVCVPWGNCVRERRPYVRERRRVLLANLRFRLNIVSLYDQPTAPVPLKVQMIKAEAMETELYGYATWCPTVAHRVIQRTAHYSLLLRCIG